MGACCSNSSGVLKKDLNDKNTEIEEISVEKRDFIQRLKQRRAVKSFQETSPDEIDIDPILDAITLTPTSFGLQPFTVRVIKDEASKRDISPCAYDQPQITECTYLLVFCATSDATGMCNRYIEANQLEENNPDYALMIRGIVGAKDESEMLAWSHAQASIALGVALAMAAEMKIDCCPMEGFSPDAVKKIMGLPAHEKPVAFLAIGKAHVDKAKSVPYPKFNFEEKELFIKM